MNYNYDQESLKINPKKPTTEITQKEEEHLDTKESSMSTKKAILVVIMLIAMYIAVSALPTFVLMFFFGIDFWMSQLICFIGIVLIVWIFGLHKPASNEQKLKSKFLL